MMTREKQSSTDRRVIVDLSWPVNASVNSNVEPDTYMGTQFALKYPTIDDIVNRILDLNGECLLYKVDLRRAFRQLETDLADAKFIGLYWQDQYYLDTSIPFGYRHGAVCCQRTTDAIRYIMFNKGFFIFNYIDDLIGCDTPDIAIQAIQVLVVLLHDLGLPTSLEKLCKPNNSALSRY